MSLKKNLVVNCLGQGWRALMSLAFIPLYIQHLGIDAFGLIGIFAILQAWLVVLDLVIRSALGPEMLRLAGDTHDAQSIRNLLRSVEIIGIAISGAVAFGIWTASGWLASEWLASDWLMAKNLPVEVVAQAFTVMGVVTALQLIESIYASSIGGLQRQNLQKILTIGNCGSKATQNSLSPRERAGVRAIESRFTSTAIYSLVATARGLGAVGILVWVSPTIKAFFIWQGVVSLIVVVLFAGIVYHTLPFAPLPVRNRSLKKNVVANYLAVFKPDLSRYRRIAKEGSWIVVGQIASVLGALVLVRVLTERLDSTQYGQLALGLTVAGLVNQVVMGGVNNGISRFYSIAAEKEDLGGYLRASRRLMNYATLAVLVIGLTLVGGLLFMDYTKWIALAVAALVFSILSGYNSTLSGIQNAARQRAIVAFHGGLDAWLKILLALGVLLWLGNSSTAVVIGYALSSFLVTGSQFIFLRRLISRQSKPNGDGRQWVLQMWAYSWPFSTFGIFTWVQLSSDRWALEAFTTTQDVGLYAVLFQLGYTPISMATGLAMSFLGPILYQRSGNATDHTRNDNVHRLAWRTTLFCMVLTLIAFMLALGLHDWIFRLLVAMDYRNTSYLLPWMVLAGGIFAAGQMLALKMMSELKSKAMIWAKIGTAILGVLFNLYGASVAGVMGIVMAAVAFSAIYFLWMFLLSLRHNTESKVS